MTTTQQPHRSGLTTEDYRKLTGFDGDWRDTWWCDDFLAMMGRKWRLSDVGEVLDVGCGVGHWGQRLMRHTSATTTLLGVDAEPQWVQSAADRARERGLADRARYKVADAMALPFDDGSFDMVTCQTLLMHVPDAQAVVREMVRTLRPGGLFLAAEPNNFGNSAAMLVAGDSLPWEDIAPLLEMQHTCALGKEALGEGFYSAGERIPGYLLACGWPDVQVVQNHKSAPLLPPYASLNQRTTIEFMRHMHDTNAVMVMGGTIENARRFFLAGGGTEARFMELFERWRKRTAVVLEAIDAGTWTNSGGHMHYLVWGHKPC